MTHTLYVCAARLKTAIWVFLSTYVKAARQWGLHSQFLDIKLVGVGKQFNTRDLWSAIHMYNANCYLCSSAAYVHLCSQEERKEGDRRTQWRLPFLAWREIQVYTRVITHRIILSSFTCRDKWKELQFLYILLTRSQTFLYCTARGQSIICSHLFSWINKKCKR